MSNQPPRKPNKFTSEVSADGLTMDVILDVNEPSTEVPDWLKELKERRRRERREVKEREVWERNNPAPDPPPTGDPTPPA